MANFNVFHIFVSTDPKLINNSTTKTIQSTLITKVLNFSADFLKFKNPLPNVLAWNNQLQQIKYSGTALLTHLNDGEWG